MAFFADLSHLQFDLIADSEASADGAGMELHAFRSQVLREVARINVCANAAHIFDVFHGQKAELAMSAISMDIAFDAMIGQEHSLRLIDFLLAFASTGGDGNDAHGNNLGRS